MTNICELKLEAVSDCAMMVPPKKNIRQCIKKLCYWLSWLEALTLIRSTVFQGHFGRAVARFIELI